MTLFRRLRLVALACTLMIALAAVPARAAGATSGPGYPSPERAGFHQAALVYHDAAPDAATLARYVAYRPDGTTPERRAWMFDAFVEAAMTAPSGASTAYGPTTEQDWLTMLDWWFGGAGSTGALGQLDGVIDATGRATATDGRPMGAPPAPRKVMIMMPWPDPAQRAFGTVDGSPADLSRLSDRTRVVGWYTRLIEQRFAAQHYEHLALWGVYFVREDAILSDQPWVRQATTQVHAAGTRALWIPYWSAPGWDTWQQLGFDVAFVQPSAAFRGPMDGGDASASRIRSTAAQAAAHGLGVEIEARSGASTVRERAMFRQYLAEGTREGFQQAANAWFLGLQVTPMNAGNAAYSDVAQYILGRAVEDLDLHPAWTWSGSTLAAANFDPRSDLNAIRVDLDETPGRPWLGRVVVEARVGASWHPAGWAWRTTQEPLDAGIQTVTVPLAHLAGVTGLRVHFETQAGSPAPLQVSRMVADTAWVGGDANLALGRPYTTVASAPGPAAHPDSSAQTTVGFGDGKLNSGTWSDQGWQAGQSIGWFKIGGEVAVQFDLGRTTPVDEIVVHTHGGTYQGSNWPLQAGAVLTTDCPVTASSGRGVAPCDGVYAPASAPFVTNAGGPYQTDQSGYLVLQPPSGARARWVTFSAVGNGWLTLDDIQIFSRGLDVAGTAIYHLATYPTPKDQGGYPDDGTRLTNGRIASPFAPAMLTGWTQDHQETVTIDLGRSEPVSSVVVWAQVYPSWGIENPGGVEVALSADGTSWASLGSTTSADPSMPDALGFRVDGATQPARWVRVVIPPTGASWAWSMLSQVEVY